MGRVVSGITTSVDGYFVGPGDGPGKGLGEGGEALHSWVFGGRWSYAEEPRGVAFGEDKAYLDAAMANTGAVIGGRWTYEAADHWGGRNPWSVPFFIVTHRPEEQPASGGFTFVGGLEEALARARDAAGDGDVQLMGGGDIIRQALRAGYVEEFTLTIAPIVLGGGKRLFEGFDERLELQHVGVRQSPFATHITYRPVRQ
ncbi:MAG TPA: dihydrofolate reductase family protein [Candidatus Dormibacteraeota bacterium]|nr:dihydrofolate reductase family protein [Candidatus Dormibacteraeota bacterium]